MLAMNSSYLHVLNRICEDVQQEMGAKMKEENEIEWTVNVEVLFLYSMIGHKPVGVNRYFMMSLIHNRFSSYLNLQIASKVLWDHLDSMYDMAALHESEIIPFSNDETDYELPEECHDLVRTKLGVTLKRSENGSDTSRSGYSIRVPKKLTPKLKQTSTPENTPKSNFASPVLNKPLKSQPPVKSEAKTPSTYATPKVKSESGPLSKTSKVKRSSSPFATKLIKSESTSVMTEDSSDILSNKKTTKSERGSSPAIVKKPLKAESAANVSSSKKPIKSESSSNGSKSSKADSSDSISKKAKADKDVVNKKGKSADLSTKKLKMDASTVKKRSDSESSSKRDSSSAKHNKAESKSSSHSSKGETETSSHSGSRKSSPAVKGKASDSGKKAKRSKMEESSRKATPTAKRRRPN